MQLFLAILLLSCSQLGSQLFLPALPEIAQYFSITNSYTQYILMLYFMSFGLSQLIYGPWSDNVGRRKVFLIGQGVYIVGCLLAVFASSPELLAFARILQGLGAGSALIISRTVLSDQLTGIKLNQAIASLAIAASVIAVVTPVLGAWLSSINNWQGVFIILTIHLIFVWCLAYKMLSNNSVTQQSIDSSNKTSVSSLIRGFSTVTHDLHLITIEYAKLLTNFHFINIGLFKWLTTMLFLSSVTFFPFEFQQKLHLSVTQYGFLITLATCGLIIGAVLAKILHKKLGYRNILLLFWPLLFISGLGLYLLPFSVETSMSCYFLFMICAGAYYPCCLQLVIEPHRQKTGTIHALLGAVDMLIFSALAALINAVFITDTYALGALYIAVSIALLISWILMYRRTQKIITFGNISHVIK
jgi:MFS family permease